MLESLPRLLMNLELINSDSSIRIHYGYSAKHVNSTQYMFHIQSLTSWRVLKWLGLEKRIITGDLVASTVILPREGACQDPLYNQHELLRMRHELINRAWENCDECDSVFAAMGCHIGMLRIALTLINTGLM